MSLSSLLLAFAPALAARFKPEKQTYGLEAEMIGLRIDLADARRDLEDMRQEMRRWRDRAQGALQAQYQQGAPPSQQQLAQLAQYAMAQQQQALQGLAGLGHAVGMLEMFASCTPSRGAALTGRRP